MVKAYINNPEEFKKFEKEYFDFLKMLNKICEGYYRIINKVTLTCAKKGDYKQVISQISKMQNYMVKINTRSNELNDHIMQFKMFLEMGVFDSWMDGLDKEHQREFFKKCELYGNVLLNITIYLKKIFKPMTLVKTNASSHDENKDKAVQLAISMAASELHDLLKLLSHHI